MSCDITRRAVEGIEPSLHPGSTATDRSSAGLPSVDGFTASASRDGLAMHPSGCRILDGADMAEGRHEPGPWSLQNQTGSAGAARTACSRLRSASTGRLLSIGVAVGMPPRPPVPGHEHELTSRPARQRQLELVRDVAGCHHPAHAGGQLQVVQHPHVLIEAGAEQGPVAALEEPDLPGGGAGGKRRGGAAVVAPGLSHLLRSRGHVGECRELHQRGQIHREHPLVARAAAAG
jgi:hypothetical protein